MEKALVIIPTYNEAENVQKVIVTTFRDHVFDVLVVDDSSPDGTADLVLKLIKTYPSRLFLEHRARKEGLGKAYLHGFKWALEKNTIIFSRWMLIYLTIPKNYCQCFLI